MKNTEGHGRAKEKTHGRSLSPSLSALRRADEEQPIALLCSMQSQALLQGDAYSAGHADDRSTGPANHPCNADDKTG